MEDMTMLFETAITTPVYGLRREVNRLFDDVMSRTLPSTAWIPPVDVREDDAEILLTAELPGIAPEQVEVTTDSGVLTIRGEKRAERKEGDDGRYQLVERSYGNFTRSFRLPKGADEGKITADFEHGILKVHVPRAALPQPKKIAIGMKGSDSRNVTVDNTRRPASGAKSA
jgi:HSP20 family protein